MTGGRVLVTCRQMQVELPRHRERIEAAGYEIVAPVLEGQQLSENALVPLMDKVVGFVAGDDEITARVMDAAPELRAIVRWGIGMDSVDAEAARARAISLTNTPGVFSDEVADSAFAYVLSLARGHHLVDRAVRDGGWPKVEGTTLAGSMLGVVGYGGIGRAVARRAVGFGMDVLVHDPYVPAGPADTGLRAVREVEELLERARFVVLTCPATPETRHLIDASALARMRPDAFLVNVARGSVVDEQALIAALGDGLIAGAGLDVFEVEPLPSGSPLRAFPQVLLGAHNGSNTREGVARASAAAVHRLMAALEGQA